MIDITVIKENYARMADEQLIDLIKKDGNTITYEAFIVLKREFIKRNLDQEIIRKAEELRVEETKNKVLANLKREDWIIDQVLWKLTLTQKASGKTNNEIIETLKQKGVSPESATEALTKMEAYLRIGLKKLQKAILLSIVFILIGIIMCVSVISAPANFSFYIASGMLIIAGLKFLPANHRAYQLYVKAITVIEEEKAEKMQ